MSPLKIHQRFLIENKNKIKFKKKDKIVHVLKGKQLLPKKNNNFLFNEKHMITNNLRDFCLKKLFIKLVYFFIYFDSRSYLFVRVIELDQKLIILYQK